MSNPSERLSLDPVYTVARTYSEQGWGSDGSVLTPGHPIWTAAVFEELHRDFVSRADFGSGTFAVKLRKQIGGSSDAAKQLMAELLGLHLLVSNQITGAKKVALVSEVLSWMKNPVTMPEELVAAFGHGFISPGTYYNTGRPALLGYLVETGRRWKLLEPGRRADALSDPWKFKEAIGEASPSGANSQRHVLLHLLFPETFEPIVSDDNLAKIIRAFPDAVAPTTTDPDRKLQEIRAFLTPRYGEGFSFYDSRLKPIWDQGVDPWKELIRWATRFYESPVFDEVEREYKLRSVEGVPELVNALREGREWLADLQATIKHRDNNLTDWRLNDSFLDWATENSAAASEALRSLLLSPMEPPKRLQAFADGVQAGVDTPGGRATLGSYLLMGTAPTELPIYKPNPFKRVMALVGRTPASGSEGERYADALQFCDEIMQEAEIRGLRLRDRLDVQSLVWTIAKAGRNSPLTESWTDSEWRSFLIWRGDVEADEPGGPEGQPQTETNVDTSPSEDWMQRAALATHLPVEYLNRLRSLLADKGQIVFYGPPGTGKTFVAQSLARALCEGDLSRTGLVQFHPSTTYEDFFEGIRPRTDPEGRLHYEVRPGPLARFADLAQSEPDQQFVLVIDELNRANLPKVLGELLFLLEYRGEAAFTLYRAEKPFQLPKNLWFIATMNTVDRSVALVDAAMRRRFHFVPFYPDSAPISEVLPAVCGDADAWVANLVAMVNSELVADLGSRDHQLGASHFIKCERSLDALEQLWTYTVEPLIEDQFYGQEDRVEKYRWSKVLKRHAEFIPGAEMPGLGLNNDPEADE